MLALKQFLIKKLPRDRWPRIGAFIERVSPFILALILMGLIVVKILQVTIVTTLTVWVLSC